MHSSQTTYTSENTQCLNSRKLYTPSSTIYYRSPEVGAGLTDKLTSGHFDRSQPSGENRELRPHSRSDPPRRQQRVRDLGHHKTGEFAYYKR